MIDPKMPDLFGTETPEGDKNLPLKGVRIALVGDFAKSKSNLTEEIVKRGGDKNVSLSKKSYVVAMGENPSDKDLEKLDMLRHDGFHIPEISEEKLMDILQGRDTTIKFHKIKKEVDIDYDFIVNPKYRCLVPVSKDGITHCLGCREIFVHKDGANIELFWQVIGNLGGAASPAFDPTTTDFIMLSPSTMEKLKNGMKGDTIALVESTYNSSKNEKFTYRFILEDDFMSFAWKRSKAVKDEITLDLLNKYESD